MSRAVSAWRASIGGTARNSSSETRLASSERDAAVLDGEPAHGAVVSAGQRDDPPSSVDLDGESVVHCETGARLHQHAPAPPHGLGSLALRWRDHDRGGGRPEYGRV